MFSDEAPPLEWDTKNEYKIENLEMYYLTNFDEVLSKVGLFNYILFIRINIYI